MRVREVLITALVVVAVGALGIVSYKMKELEHDWFNNPVPDSSPSAPQFRANDFSCQDVAGGTSMANNTMQFRFAEHNIVRAVDSAGYEYMIVIPQGWVCRIAKR